MGFSDFHGNAETVHRLREMLARDRFPHGVILTGRSGSGKYTLATMVASAMNCLEHPVSDGLPDFCGECRNCVQIGAAAPLSARFDEAVAAREELREVDKKETRILIQTHPDVLVIPPDPPQMLIAWPVILLPVSAARKATRPATSSGSTISPSGTRDMASFRNCSTEIPRSFAMSRIPSRAISVSVQPGHSALTVILRGASSKASARVKPINPVFAVQ